MANLRCQACLTFFAPSVKLMIQHLVRVHRSDPNLHIVCEISGCHQSFSKVYSYKTHLYQKHRDFENNVAEAENTTQLSTEETDEPMIVDEYSEVNNSFNNKNKRENAFFLLQVKEKNLLTQRSLDEIVLGTTELIKSTVTTVENGVRECLDTAGILFDAVPGLKELFSPDNVLCDPFEHISTKHKQVSFYKKEFGLIEPQRITVGHRSVQRRSGTRYREFLRDDEIMYIPLLEILQQLLNMDFVISEIRKGHKNRNGVIEDFCDGQLFKAHPLFSKDPTALQLMLYYDELEITNPLGSKTGKHKLGTVYLILGNIPPKYRSTLNSIQLLAVATYPIIKEYGIDSLFEPIMNDLAELEKDGGYQFMVKCQPVSFAGTIAFISADNLGAQLVGGFKESASASLKCRHCMGNACEICQHFLEKDFTRRTRDGHDHQCTCIEEDPEMSKLYGVNRRSILCNSRYFHVVDGLPADAMHDILEGVLQYKCKEMLNILIYEQKYFTLQELNEKLKTFDYGYYNDRNKPSPITRQALKGDANNVRQKAAQMWCLGKFLPLMVGNLVATDDEHWQHFHLLLEIVDIVFAPSATLDALGILEGLIEEYLLGFVRLYPGKSIIPKMHYLVHYPSHIYRFGPMTRTWCMRYEAKHSYFKTLAAYMGNYTNVAYTLADRHQTHSCYINNSASGNVENNIYRTKEATVGVGKQVVIGDSTYFDVLKEHEDDLLATDIVHEPKKVSIHGTEYRIGAVVHIGWMNEMPEFAVIDKMVVVKISKVYFVLTKFVTVQFSSHFHAFEVYRPTNDQTVIVQQTQFVHYLPAHTVALSRNTRGLLYIAPRCTIVKY